MVGHSSRHRRAAEAGRRAAERFARTTTVTIVVDQYSGPVGAVGSTLLSTSETVLSPRPKVAPAGDAGASVFGGGVATLSVGGAVVTEYAIGPVTLDYPGGGYDLATLLPLGAVDRQVRVRLEGDAFETEGEFFEVVPGSVDATRPHQVTFRVRRSPQ